MWPGKVHKKSANCRIIWREIFIHLHLPKLYMHPTTVDCDTQDGRNMMWEFVVDQTNSHRVMNKLFCVNKISEYDYKKKQIFSIKVYTQGRKRSKLTILYTCFQSSRIYSGLLWLQHALLCHLSVFHTATKYWAIRYAGVLTGHLYFELGIFVNPCIWTSSSKP